MIGHATVRVPASSANLGPGFDAVGLALGLWDEYSVEPADTLAIDVTGQGASGVPRDARHLVHRLLATGLAHWGVDLPPVRLACRNAVPHSRGLGSSATAAVGGLALASVLATGAVDAEAVLRLASAHEGHPDNAAASVLGGLTVSWADAGAVSSARIGVHPAIEPVALVPHNRLSTAAARAALPASVPLATAAAGAGRAALLVEAMSRRPDLLLPATVDVLHQEPRRSVYPDTMALVDDLRAAGHAAVVSGAGPTVLVLTTDPSSVVSHHLPPRWRILRPGIAARGAHAVLDGVAVAERPAEVPPGGDATGRGHA